MEHPEEWNKGDYRIPVDARGIAIGRASIPISADDAFEWVPEPFDSIIEGVWRESEYCDREFEHQDGWDIYNYLVGRVRVAYTAHLAQQE